MKKILHSFGYLVLGVALGISVAAGPGVLAKPETELEGLPLEQLRHFAEVYARIKNDYVETISDETLLQGAIRGMLSSLDPHSAYLSPQDSSGMRERITGQFGGLGIEIGMEDGFVKVIAPIDDTPAQRAGIKSGDLIIRLDETSIKGLSLSEAVDLMRGEPGTEIELTVMRDGRDEPLSFTLTRAVISVRSVRHEMLEPGYGYVRISQFQSQTPKHLRDSVQALTAEHGGVLNGLIVDLRNNPGGVLSAAIGVADAFLEDGLIVYTQGRGEADDFRYNASSGDIAEGSPLVVMVNAGSASASEIVAGAVQDHDRGVILGTRTFGKGSVQTIQQLNQGGALKLTTARYYTPDGRSIQAEGIVPDIEVDERLRLARDESGGSDRLTEADLLNHLENDAPEDGASEASAAGSALETLSGDFQLYEALSLLKGYNVFGRR